MYHPNEIFVIVGKQRPDGSAAVMVAPRVQHFETDAVVEITYPSRYDDYWDRYLIRHPRSYNMALTGQMLQMPEGYIYTVDTRPISLGEHLAHIVGELPNMKVG